MASLRELLDQQRKAKANAEAAKPVLQSGPEKTTQQTAQTSAQNSGTSAEIRKPSVLDRLKAKPVTGGLSEPVSSTVAGTGPTTGQSVSNIGASDTGGKTEIEPTKMVEQSRPLTIAEKLKARMQANASKNSDAGTLPAVDATVASGIPKETKAVQENIQGSSVPAIPNEISSGSASQTADAQKTNDGLANISELKHNLAYLANNIDSKELVGQVVRTIATQLQKTPELTNVPRIPTKRL